MAVGKPTVVLATEAFGKLIRISLKARALPEALAIIVKGNPELLDEPAVTALADRVFDEVAVRLSGGAAHGGALIT